jgi:competence protein ComFC
MIRLLSEISSRSRLFLDDLFAFISSPLCSGCGQNLENNHLPLCDSCRTQLSAVFHGEGPVCLTCHAPQAVSCKCSIDNKYITPQMLYWSDYTDTIRNLIHGFKFQGDKKLGYHLTEMALQITRDRLLAIDCDIIVPIPLRPIDKRHRGFNQTELIASEISRLLNIPLETDLLIKTRNTKLQANLTAKERWLNVKGIFSVQNKNSLQGQSVLLVDDIVTTGATCMEAARALYDAGAENITVFALACADTRKLAD